VATQYHLTPEGPRKCSVDPSKPNSRGCKYDSMHFDSFSDAMEVYETDLKAAFGEFSVLVRPSARERARRAGYLGLDGVEKVRANPQVRATVNSLRTLATKAREATAEIRSHYREELNSNRADSLPETVATRPLAVEDSPEDTEALRNSEETFSGTQDESLSDFSDRIAARSRKTSFNLVEVDGSERDAALALLDAQREHRKEKKEEKPSRMSAYRSARRRRANLAKARVESAIRSGREKTSRAIIDSGYAARASVTVAKEAAKLRAQNARVRTAKATQSVQKAASRMSVPASHIRPGDTFDGTTVRAVEAVAPGKIKISYQAEANGPILSATVPSDRSMKVDRKTRREARNSRISSRVAAPIARTRELSSRVARASAEQLAGFDRLMGTDKRFGAISREIRQAERRQEQSALINRLRALRSESSDRVLQNS